MRENIETETWVTENGDGSITLDAYAGMSRESLKERCRELCCIVSDWQMIAMILAESNKDGLSVEQRTKLENLIKAYAD